MQIFTSVFLHEDLAQSAQKSSVEQYSAYSTICPNLSWITPFLPRTLGAPSCLLQELAGDDRNPYCNANYRWNLRVSIPQNLLWTPFTIFSYSLGPSCPF